MGQSEPSLLQAPQGCRLSLPTLLSPDASDGLDTTHLHCHPLCPQHHSFSLKELSGLQCTRGTASWMPLHMPDTHLQGLLPFLFSLPPECFTHKSRDHTLLSLPTFRLHDVSVTPWPAKSEISHLPPPFTCLSPPRSFPLQQPF